MNIRERMLAVLNGQKPDKIPFFCFSGSDAELIPAGSFERKLRNRGMGLLLLATPVTTEMPNISITKRKSKAGEETIYHTPIGDLFTEAYTNTNRITTPKWPVKISYFVKDVKDYEPLIYMINDTVCNLDLKEFKLKDHELGDDGILYGNVGVCPPYTESQLLLGLEKWSYEQYDHPDEFLRLLNALNKKSETIINIIAEIEYDMIITLGDIRDSISPASYMEHEVPFYEKAFKLLKSRNKKCGIHAHGSLLKRQKEVLAKINPDYIEAYTPPPYSDLPLSELRETVGKDVTILINFPESVFYEGYKKTRNYTIELLKSDPSYNKMIGFTEMGMMGVDDSNRSIFEEGFQAILDAIDTFG
jgi:hypothetical protein